MHFVESFKDEFRFNVNLLTEKLSQKTYDIIREKFPSVHLRARVMCVSLNMVNIDKNVYFYTRKEKLWSFWRRMKSEIKNIILDEF